MSIKACSGRPLPYTERVDVTFDYKIRCYCVYSDSGCINSGCGCADAAEQLQLDVGRMLFVATDDESLVLSCSVDTFISSCNDVIDTDLSSVRNTR